MAIIRFNDGTTTECNGATGIKLWHILQGNAEPTPKEEKIAMKVKKIYLNWREAPDDYIEERFAVIAPMVISHWMVEGTPSGQHQHGSIGLATRPMPGDSFTLDFCKKWGLWEKGKPTALARRHM